MNFNAWTLVLGIVFLFTSGVFAQSISYTDNWTSNSGSVSDGVAWGGYSLKTNAINIPAQSDCLCWDWCDNGSSDETVSNWDHCYCRSSTERTVCSNYSPNFFGTICSGGDCSEQALSSDHIISTGSSGNAWSCGVDVREYRDCDNSSGQRSTWNWNGQSGLPYFVVYPKQYDCDNTSSLDYDFEGDYGPGNVDIVQNIACPANKACDEEDAHLNHDDVLITNPTGSIPNPCSTVDGTTSNNSCSSWNQCLSGTCGGNRTYFNSICFSDQSNGFDVYQELFSNSCGGLGYYVGPSGYSTTCTAQMGSGYVCDADLDAYQYLNALNPQNFCKRDRYQSCSQSSECWNNNSGVNCMGSTSIGSSPNYNRICTYGSNGNSCFNNDDLQCLSLRCDSTCQAKLSNGSSCDEPSDCTANACTGGYCGTGVPNGGICTRDSDCQNRYCVADSSSQSHCQNPAAYLPYTHSFDTWDAAASNSQSTGSDQIAFTGTAVRPVTFDLRESTDMLCYDFDGDNTYDACYYDPNGCSGGCSSTSCNYPIPNSVPSEKKFSCDVDSYAGCQIGVNTIDQICASSLCSVSTSTIKTKNPRVTAFYDCDGSDGLQSQHTLADSGTDVYWVVNPKYYYCSTQTSPGSQYFTLGDYGPAYTDSKLINGPLSCSSGTSCSILADEQYVNSASGVIPSACKTNVGGTCSQNSDCLYNKCQGSTCTNGFIYEGFLEDELANPLSNYTIKQYTCSNSFVQNIQTDSDGKFVFASGTGSYITKLVVPWGEVEFGFSDGVCHNFGQGFIAGTTWMYNTHTTVHGRTITPQGDPEVGLPWELSTCQDATLTSTNTNSNGDFQLYTNSGRQKIKVSLNGTKFPLEDTSGNTCFLNYGDVDLGQMEVTANCTLYNNTCSTEDSRLFNCSFDSQQGCVCSIQYCSAGCTDGAPQCNAVGTGTIHVIVKNNDRPVKNAPVWVNDASKGQTNGKGKLDINEEHGPHIVRTSCPDTTQPTIIPVYLNGNHRYVTFNLDCGDPPKGKLTISSWTIDNYPAANVQVLMDNEVIGSTNGFGVIQIDDVEFGSHPVIIRYLLENNGTNVAYQQTKLADINQSSNAVDFTIYPAGQMGPGVTEISTSAFPLLLLVPIGVFVWNVLDVTSTAIDIADFCSCALGEDSPQNEFLTCINYLTPCKDESTGSQCKAASKRYGTVDECADELAFVAIDAGAIGIPLGLANKTLLVLPAVAKDLKYVDEIFKFGGKIIQKGSNWVEYTTRPVNQWTKKYYAKLSSGSDRFLWKIRSVGVTRLTDDGALALERIADRYGPNAENNLLNLINRTDGHFTITKEYMEKTYDGMGVLKNSNLTTADYVKIEQKFVDNVRFGNFANIKGILAEIEVAASPKFSNIVSNYDVPVSYGRRMDYRLTNGELVEVKAVDIISLRASQSPSDIQSYINIINSLAGQLVGGNSISPYTKLHAVFPRNTTTQLSNVQGIKDDLRSAMHLIDNTFDESKFNAWIVLEGVD